jgi:hypothetical protein
VEGTGLTNADLVYVGGAAGPGFLNKIGTLKVSITPTTNVTLLRLWLDTCVIDVLGFGMKSTTRSAMRFEGECFVIGDIMLWIDPGHTVTTALEAAGSQVIVNNFHTVTGTGGATITNLIRASSGSKVSILNLYAGIVPTNLFYDATSKAVTTIYENNVGYRKVVDRLNLFSSTAGTTKTDPGTAYVEFNYQMRRVIDLTGVKQARISVSAIGNEAGSGKGVCVYDVTNGQVLCEKTWDGSTQIWAAGNWTDIDVAEIKISVYVKGSSATEDITIYQVVLETR